MGEVVEFLDEFDLNRGHDRLADWPLLPPAKEVAGFKRISVELWGSGVYLLLARGEVVYVGSSRNLLRRFMQHKDVKHIKFDQFAYVLIAAADIARVEELYIRKYQPRYNKIKFVKPRSSFEELGIDIAKLIRENPAKVELKQSRASWRRV